MSLVTLQHGKANWPDIRDAAAVLWRAMNDSDSERLRAALEEHFQDPSVTIVNLHKGVGDHCRAVLATRGRKITIAFKGAQGDDFIKCSWTDGKGSGWWELPYPFYNDGHRVHAFFHDVCREMRATVCEELNKVVEAMLAKGEAPEQIVVSTMAFLHILEHIRSTWGSSSTAPQAWAEDANLPILVQHLTFAAVPAGDQGYYTILNDLYRKYQIRAWDFMCHYDLTQHLHHWAFRSWRGHRYVLEDNIVRYCDGSFGREGHAMKNLKAAEWMSENGTDEVKSAYSY